MINIDTIKKKFLALLQPEQLKDAPEDLRYYGTDWTKHGKPNPILVVLPRTTAEVSAVLKLCSAEKLAVVPSGGRTGLAGGAMATNGEVVLSLEKMNRILGVDPYELSLTAEAGCTLESVQDAAKEQGLLFPLDLGAKGSCHIGGNFATNAGGLHFIRYGGARDQVLGLEVVLADGTILELGSALRKDNTGYDLKQLIIGSEGTLAVITKVIVKLQAEGKAAQNVMLFGIERFDQILEILLSFRRQGLALSAFEFFARNALDIVLKEKGHPEPLGAAYPFYVLVEADAVSEAELSAFIETLFEKGFAQDGTLAQGSTEERQLWAYREQITESIASYGQVRKSDITIRISELSPFVAELEGLLTKEPLGGMELVFFGHVGDGNIHVNYVMPRTANVEEARFKALVEPLIDKVYAMVYRFKGSISAEHGIGTLKKKELPLSRSPLELSIMREIKRIFDPQGILNPGKIFD